VKSSITSRTVVTLCMLMLSRLSQFPEMLMIPAIFDGQRCMTAEVHFRRSAFQG
jgi:hypothetical protein